MEDNLIGKCFKLRNQLICIKRDISIKCNSTSDALNCYICSCLTKLEDNSGYKSYSDIIFNVAGLFGLVDSTINDKIYKLLKMNSITCNSILKLAEKPDKSTKYTKCMFPVGCYKLFHRVGYHSEVMVKVSPECACISTVEDTSYEKFSLITEEQILPETYTKVRDIVVDTINQIDEIWTSI